MEAIQINTSLRLFLLYLCKTKIKKMVTIIKKGMSREKILIALKNRPEKIKGPDLKKYCGSITLIKDPMELQKIWRNDWD